MPVSYPLQIPDVGITSVDWTNTTSSLISRSPFSFQGQAQSYGGGIRLATITVDDLNREQAEDWVGFLDSLHGTLGTFLFGDPMAKTPMGTGVGNPEVLTANTVARDIITVSGLPTSGTHLNWLKRGDWIQLGSGLNSRLYKVVQNVNKNNTTGNSGNIYIWPKLRNTPAVGDPVIINNPKGLFRRSNGSFNYSEQGGCKYSLSFSCEEVI